MAYIGRQLGQGVRNRFIYTATAGQTTFSGSDDNGITLVYTDGTYVDVNLNGVELVSGTDYTATSGTSIVLTTGASLNDTLSITVYDVFAVADTVSAQNGGTFSGDVNVNGDLAVDTNTLFVDANTNSVGIGTSSIDFTTSGRTVVHIEGSSGALLAMEDTGAKSYFFQSGNDLLLENDTTTGSMIFGTNSSTERMRIDSSGNLKFNSGYGSVATAYGCRAWVNFNGTGTVAIRGSGNVSSITDNNAGNYTVNFTTAMTDSNYAVGASFQRLSASGDMINIGFSNGVGSFNVETFSGGVTSDMITISLVVLR